MCLWFGDSMSNLTLLVASRHVSHVTTCPCLILYLLLSCSPAPALFHQLMATFLHSWADVPDQFGVRHHATPKHYAMRLGREGTFPCCCDFMCVRKLCACGMMTGIVLLYRAVLLMSSVVFPLGNPVRFLSRPVCVCVCVHEYACGVLMCSLLSVCDSHVRSDTVRDPTLRIPLGLSAISMM